MRYRCEVVVDLVTVWWDADGDGDGGSGNGGDAGWGGDGVWDCFEDDNNYADGENDDAETKHDNRVTIVSKWCSISNN